MKDSDISILAAVLNWLHPKHGHTLVHCLDNVHKALLEASLSKHEKAYNKEFVQANYSKLLETEFGATDFDNHLYDLTDTLWAMWKQLKSPDSLYPYEKKKLWDHKLLWIESKSHGANSVLDGEY